MSEEQLKEIEARWEKATKGPWWYNNKPFGVTGEVKAKSNDIKCLAVTFGNPRLEDEKRYASAQLDAQFLTHSHQDIRTLLDAVKELNRELDDVYKYITDNEGD